MAHRHDDAIFKVRSSDGHEWVIYGDGDTEGFPEGCTVFNRIGMFMTRAGDAAVQQLISGDEERVTIDA